MQTKNFFNEDKKVILLNNITIKEIKRFKQKGSLFIYDFCLEAYKAREIIYNKYKISNLLCDFNNWELEKLVHDRIKLFKNIAIFSSQNGILDTILKEYNGVTKIDINDCVWESEKECYNYTNKFVENIESVFMLVNQFEHPYMLINDSYVPINAVKYLKQNDEYISADYDIAFNIIPKLQKNNIKYIVINNPDTEYDLVKSLLAKDIKDRNSNFFHWSQRDEITKFIDASGDGNEELVEELAHITFTLKSGFKNLSDMQGSFVNIVNGSRYTYGNPKTYKHLMYLFGPCFVYGLFVEDKYTLGSYLRNKVDSGYYIKNLGPSQLVTNYAVRKNKYKKGDIVIIVANDLSPYKINGIKVHSIINAFKNTSNLEKHIWECLSHCNKVVTKHISDEIYNICMREHLFQNIQYKQEIDNEVSFGFEKKEINIPYQLKEWICTNRKYKKKEAKKAGAVVMNCNPFTLGHRFLIETAKKEVDVLYIFVVEENKSFFDFKDRIRMVELGTSDIENVIVVPSGKYIISTETLPGYFDKDEQPYIECDATNDLELFADVIAKEFDIQVRFVGEEPTDPFTNQYNQEMRKILPMYGIVFREITRKQLDNRVISASLVREYLKKGKYEEIKKLVLPSIYSYLEKFFL